MSKRKASDGDGLLLLLVGEINEETYEKFAIDFATADSVMRRGGIVVRITSPGGQSSFGLGIYDIICGAQNPVRTEAYGDCSSVAACILQAGTVRSVSYHTRLLVHHGMAHLDSGGGRVNGKFLRDMVKMVQDTDQVIVNILAQRAHVDRNRMNAYCREEHIFSAQEAVLVGLADKVIDNPRWRD